MNGVCENEARQTIPLTHQAELVDINKLSQVLMHAFKVTDQLTISGSQAHLLVEIKNSLSYVNNTLVKSQNAVPSSSDE